MNGQEIRPSRWYYGLAGLIFVGGWVAFGLLLFKNLSGLSEKLQQVVVPGSVELSLTKPGKYTIYYEHESVVGNRVYSTGESVSGLECTVVSKASGTAIPVSRSTVSSTYSIGGRSGRSFLDFRIDTPGIYQLSANYAEGYEGPEVVLAVGQGFATGIVTTIFGALAIVFGSIGLAATIAAVTAYKRHQAAKRAQNRYAL